MSLTSGNSGSTVAGVTLAVRPARTVTSFWSSSIGKKAVMAVTGLLMLLFLLAHMLGNLKIFFGPADFNGYAHWLRTIGEPVLHDAWYLWLQRVVLVVALVLHVTAAAQLSARDLAARPDRYRHRQRWQAGFATRTMRWGGVLIFLFLVWHILDLSVGVANPDHLAGQPYHDVVADFTHWWINLIYLAAMVVLGLHIDHGFRSAARTLGLVRPHRAVAVRVTGSVLALAVSIGFSIVPVAVMTGWVR
jgi:succinate dehydrogenase cytochrome b subunit